MEYRILSSGMWLHLVWKVFTNVSEKHVASIFRVEGPDSEIIHNTTTYIFTAFTIWNVKKTSLATPLLMATKFLHQFYGKPRNRAEWLTPVDRMVFLVFFPILSGLTFIRQLWIYCLEVCNVSACKIGSHLAASCKIWIFPQVFVLALSQFHIIP
jgi:hypothetical protein